MSDLIIPMFDALADKHVLVVAVIHQIDRVESFETPNNIPVAKYLPFNELFKHADFLVSNAGYGTVQQALFCGVPMILAGVGEDKPETCARAVWSGVAVNLKCLRPSVKQIRNAFDTVLSNAKYKVRDRELAEEYRRYDTIAEIEAAIQLRLCHASMTGMGCFGVKGRKRAMPKKTRQKIDLFGIKFHRVQLHRR